VALIEHQTRGKYMTNLLVVNSFNYNSDEDLVSAREHINQAYHMDEEECVRDLLIKAKLSDEAESKAGAYAREFVEKIRASKTGKGGLDAFLLQYDLSSQEGTALMCMAEALLRIPDSDTRDKLIRDKIGSAGWDQHLGKSKVLFVNAATFALMLTGKIVKREEVSSNNLKNTFKKLVERLGEPVIRQAVGQAMKILGRQFVMAETIDSALVRAKDWEEKSYTYSYDMLGEAARTDKDADYYYQEYHDAIEVIAKAAKNESVNKNPGISVKLSAIDARYEIAKPHRINTNLVVRLRNLAILAKKANIGLTVDAEESYRLDISLDIFEAVFKSPELNNWHGFGLVVQAYQKRAYRVLEYLQKLSAKYNKKIMVRLVKGAYWDSEVKHSQVAGLPGYPVFTRKPSTDVSYQACAKFLLKHQDNFYPQFATHNAYTLGSILAMADPGQDFEFQRLHGMGEELHEQVAGNPEYGNKVCRIYAPVGGYKHLLAYLVRRLLENGANTSFVNRLIDESLSISEIVKSVTRQVEAYDCKPHDKIKLPLDIFVDRKNSKGLDLTDRAELNNITVKFNKFAQSSAYVAMPKIADKDIDTKVLESINVVNPANTTEVLGKCYLADENLANHAITTAVQGFNTWSKTDVFERAQCLNKMADLMEENIYELIYLCIKEAGKTIGNAIAEIREAVDFCRYYANEAINNMSTEILLPGPTGELNKIGLYPKGVFVCISPWNFPLAIFIGQVVAALVTGNTVIAKPAEQTPLIANFAVELLYKAGIAKNALQFLPGYGSVVGKVLTSSDSIAGVIFTGSCETAAIINKSLANRKTLSLATVIAETGGLNTMLVDSSSLPEQVIRDVMNSAFDSAGQRCSALRLIYVQEDIADSLINMLIGAMRLAKIGDPIDLATDIGPVIDHEAQTRLLQHLATMDRDPKIKCLYKSEVPDHSNGIFMPIALYELETADQLKEEFFGPILHLVRYKSQDVEAVLDSINNTGYALTFGIHSRIDYFTDYVCSRIRAGNCYVNRNMVGAVVGVQPFGGSNLSGTGPKAGGANYIKRLCIEKTVSVDTTASGGNASLLCLD
jgi:RHH-type proline utilization regulon transcriptional repressor/proline dehydrogenase/delta 1-pyrroline-5-carboxylate dehydrogenase